MSKYVTVNVLSCSLHSCVLGVFVWALTCEVCINSFSSALSLCVTPYWAVSAERVWQSRAFRSAPKSPALVGISWGKKTLRPWDSAHWLAPHRSSPQTFSSLISLIWCWPFSSIHFPWNRSLTLTGIARTPPPSSTLHDLAYFGRWSRHTDRMLPVGKNWIGVFFPLFFSHHHLLNRSFLSKLSFLQ